MHGSSRRVLPLVLLLAMRVPHGIVPAVAYRVEIDDRTMVFAGGVQAAEDLACVSLNDWRRL